MPNRRLQEAVDWKIVFQTHANQKEVGVAILISDKIDIKAETIEDEDHCAVKMSRFSRHRGVSIQELRNKVQKVKICTNRREMTKSANIVGHLHTFLND